MKGVIAARRRRYCGRSGGRPDPRRNAADAVIRLGGGEAADFVFDSVYAQCRKLFSPKVAKLD